MTQAHSIHTPAPRHDMYMAIHKAMRACMSETLSALGRMDIDDAGETAAALAQLRELLQLCDKHLQKENQFVHTAMERRRPGSASSIANEHIEHKHDIARLQRAIDALENADAPRRRDLASNLYRQVAVFIGHNFEHMEHEESDHNAVLWSAYSDAELIEIESALKASIPPQDMAIIAPWMLRANDHAFRMIMLSEVRAHAPAEVFEMLLGLAQAHLSERDWQKLAHSLELAVAA